MWEGKNPSCRQKPRIETAQIYLLAHMRARARVCVCMCCVRERERVDKFPGYLQCYFPTWRSLYAAGARILPAIVVASVVRQKETRANAVFPPSSFSVSLWMQAKCTRASGGPPSPSPCLSQAPSSENWECRRSRWRYRYPSYYSIYERQTNKPKFLSPSAMITKREGGSEKKKEAILISAPRTFAGSWPRFLWTKRSLISHDNQNHSTLI